MKLNKMIMEVAKLEGIENPVVISGVAGKIGGQLHGIEVRRCYLTDHNAVQQVIDGFTDSESDDYWLFELGAITGHWFGFKIKATASQKCEAILKAKGLLEEDND